MHTGAINGHGFMPDGPIPVVNVRDENGDIIVEPEPEAKPEAEILTLQQRLARISGPALGNKKGGKGEGGKGGKGKNARLERKQSWEQ